MQYDPNVLDYSVKPIFAVTFYDIIIVEKISHVFAVGSRLWKSSKMAWRLHFRQLKG